MKYIRYYLVLAVLGTLIYTNSSYAGVMIPIIVRAPPPPAALQVTCAVVTATGYTRRLEITVGSNASLAELKDRCERLAKILAGVK